MITDFISVYEDAISVEYCEKFIEHIEHYIDNGIMCYEPFGFDHKHHQTMNFNNHEDYLKKDATYNMLSGDRLPLTFLPMIKKYVDDYLKTYSVLGNSTLLMYDVKAKKIPVGGGFHRWHYENGSLPSSARKLVVQLYLNTVHEGGETEFLYINKRVKAKQGSLIIFPAAFTHTHRGNPPIGQEKYILTTWLITQHDDRASY